MDKEDGPKGSKKNGKPGKLSKDKKISLVELNQKA
jgi:hypothetical protein